MKLRSASALLLAAATLLFALLSRSLASKEARPRPSSSLDAALDYISLEKNKQRFVKDLLDLVSIPSISSLPERKPDVERAAVWCSERLEKAGLENVQIIRAASKTGGDDGGEPPPPSPPAVYGDWLHAGANKAIVLIYGHFDVQPADAETEPWTSPPFEPVVRGGAVWGRGAQVRSFLFSLFSFSLPLLSPSRFTSSSSSSSISWQQDDKGGLLGAIQAVEAFLKGGNGDASPPLLPVNVKFLLEGEEEVGSPNLDAFLSQHAKLLEADGALSADGAQPSASLGGLTMGLRGAAAFEIAVETLSADVHSGQFGGSVANAASALAAAVLSLHDPGTRRVAISGFYDGVTGPSARDREDVRRFEEATVVEGDGSGEAVPVPLFDEADDLRSVGATAAVGEQGFSTLERRWLRPTCDVVGMQSGFGGPPGTVKTITPARGMAKIVCRLVPGQQPEKVLAAAKRHVEGLNQREEGARGPGAGAARALASKLLGLVGLSATKAPPASREMLRGARASFSPLPFSSVPYETSRTAPALVSVERVLKRLHGGQDPVRTWMGASIPAASAFKRHLRGIDTALFAFGLARDRVHSPDESYLLSQFERSREGYVRVLHELGGGAEGEDLERARRRGAAAAEGEGGGSGSSSSSRDEL
jgi:acetylornithine deacetylase/succinyl-diaminopimelate desuccinylase-like protein